MSDEPKGKPETTLGLVTDLAKAVPVYPDLVQPLAKQLGQRLELVGRLVNVTLSPLQGFVWIAEQTRDYLKKSVAEKLKDVPPERLQAPPLNIAAPLFQAAVFATDEDTLREMYASLLASSMDSATVATAHPAFVDIIKNMSSDEARILKLFDSTCEPIEEDFAQLATRAACICLDMVYTYVENLQRLGIISSDVQQDFLRMKADLQSAGTARRLGGLGAYDRDGDDEFVGNPLQFSEPFDRLTLTTLGKQFVRACVLPKPTEGTKGESPGHP